MNQTFIVELTHLLPLTTPLLLFLFAAVRHSPYSYQTCSCLFYTALVSAPDYKYSRIGVALFLLFPLLPCGLKGMGGKGSQTQHVSIYRVHRYQNTFGPSQTANTN